MAKQTKRTRNLGELKICIINFGTEFVPLEEVFENFPRPSDGYKDIADAEAHLKTMLDPPSGAGLVYANRKSLDGGKVKSASLPDGEYVIIREVKRIKVGSIVQRTYEESSNDEQNDEQSETMNLPSEPLPPIPDTPQNTNESAPLQLAPTA